MTNFLNKNNFLQFLIINYFKINFISLIIDYKKAFKINNNLISSN